MRKHLLLAATTLSITSFSQCDFDPVISPSSVLLCPQESVELTVGDYDAYQWYQGSEPLSQDPTITVDHNNSGVEYFVEVTLDGCTEMSPPVLVDGWLFLPPFVIHGGDIPIGTGPNGEPIFCEGQTLTLELSSGYPNNIVWMNNGIAIPNETSSILTITESGSYSASGSPEVCPNYVAQGIAVDVEFLEAQQPEIVANGDELCAVPQGNSYIWYLNGAVIGSENTECIDPEEAGAYTVYVNYGQNCQIISEPYLITGISEGLGGTPWDLYPNPAEDLITVTMDPQIGTGAIYSVLDAVGKEVSTGWMPLNGSLQLDLNDLSPGTYLFQAAKDGKALAPATRFSIVK